MEARLKDKQAVEATVEVTVPATEVDAAFDRVLGQLARQVRVPGFRPGKAPRGVLVRRIGEEALKDEVREHLIERSYPEAVRQFELTPVHAHVHGGAPSQGSDYTFDFHIDLYPEIELPAIDEIVIDSEAKQVDEELIGTTVARLQSENATLVPVDRPVEASDYLLVESVKDDGEEGGSESVMPIDMEAVSDRLREQLLGKTAGEVVTLDLSRPSAETESTGEAAEDAGEPAEPRTIRIRIKDVKAKEKPAADDEFAKTLGFDDWQQALARIRESLQSQLDSQAFEEQREEFVEKLLAEASFELPRSLVSRRRNDLLENLVEDLRARGMTIEQYLENLGGEEGRQQFERELQEAAERGVRRDLVLERLLEARGTRLSDAEFERELRALAAQQGMDSERLKRERGDDWVRNYRYLVTRDRALNETVSELLARQRGEASPAGSEREGAAAETSESTESPDGAAVGDGPAGGAAEDQEKASG